MDVNVTWTGNRKDFNSIFGRFKRGVAKRVPLDIAQQLMGLSAFFQIASPEGVSQQDDRESVEEDASLSETITATLVQKVKPSKRGLDLAFAREYGLGDVIMAAWFGCRSVKEQCPEAMITYYVPGKYMNLVETFPFIDSVGRYPPPFAVQRQHDRYVDMTRVPEFHSSDKSQCRPESFAAVVEDPIHDFEPYIPPKLLRIAARKLINSRNVYIKPVVGLCPTAASDVRSYPPKHLRRLVELLTVDHFVLLFGQDRGRGLNQWQGNSLMSFVDKTDDLRELAALMWQCDYIVAVDSGLLHLAGVMHKRTLALFGNIDPISRIAYYPTVKSLYPAGELRCVPCWDKFNPCPYTTEQYGGACLNLLNGERVFKAFQERMVKGEDDQEEKLFAEIQWLYQSSVPAARSRVYPFVACKTPYRESIAYKLMVVVPHIFMGGGETQLMYLLDGLLHSEFRPHVVVLGSVDKELFPRLAEMTHVSVWSGVGSKIDFLREQILAEQPDLVLYHATDAIVKALNGVERKPVLVQILHTGVGAWTENVLKAARDVNDHCIAVADWIRRKFQPQYPVIRMSTVANGVGELNEHTNDLRQELGISADDFVVGVMSRFSGEKQLGLLIKALPELPADVKLLLAGWGVEEDFLKKLASEIAPGRVFFAGVVHDRTAFFNSLRPGCAALVSATEGNSMFLLESAVAGVPFLTTPVGAAPEMFKHNESAMFVEANVFDVTAAITRIREDTSLASGLAKNARSIVYRHNSDTVMAAGYRCVFREEMQRRIYPQSIYCTRYGGFGDILMTTPAVRYLKQAYPEAELTYGVGAHYADVLRGNPYIDRLEVGDVKFAESAKRHDLAFCFNHFDVWDTREHIASHYLRLVGADETRDFRLDLNLDGVSVAGLPDEPYTCIHTRSNFDCKNWGRPDEWQMIVDRLLEGGDQVVQIGTGIEPLYDGTLYLADRELSPRQSAKVIAGADLLVCIDSFPVHAAKAAGTKAVAIYGGASHPEFCGYPDNVNVISPSACQCQNSKSTNMRCDQNYICLKSITADMVIGAIEIAREKVTT